MDRPSAHRLPAPSAVARLLLASLLVLGATLVGALSPAAACACGAFIDPADQRSGADVLEETTVLSLQDGVETIVMGLQLDGARTGSALLVPTPAVPEVTAGQSGTLREMALATAPREVVEYTIWGENPFLVGAGAPGDGGSTQGPPVTVHEQKRVGSFEIAVLGGEAAPVRQWLQENGYALPEEIGALLDPYAEEDWTFTAVRYAADAELDGDVEPLRFDFPAETLVYPMRFSQAARAHQQVHVFVIGEVPYSRTDQPTGEQYTERPWIGDPQHHGWTWSDQTLRELTGADLPTGDGRRSVVTEFTISGEPATFTTDLAFAEDPEAATVIPTYTRTEVVAVAGIPVGYLLVAMGLTTALAVLAAVLTVVLASRSGARLRTARGPAADPR